MARPPHDPERFYHCDCLAQGEDAQHDDRFYHCDCIEESRQREASAQYAWEQEQKAERMAEALLPGTES